MTQPLFGMYQEETRPDTHLGVRSLGCGGDLEPLWLVAQAVPSASAVPCVSTLPDGWRLHYASANRGRATFVFDHDRAGMAALKVRLLPACLESSAVRNTDFNETVQQPIPGGCIVTRVKAPNGKSAVYQEVRSQLNLIVGSKSRADLRAALDKRSHGRLHLDVEAR